MTAPRQEYIWPAVLRALLTLRRDQHTTSPLDSETLALLNQPAVNGSEFYDQLRLLIADTPLTMVGQKLTRYLDFNRMGNLTVAMISSASIRESMTLLRQYPGNFFRARACANIISEKDVTVIRWQPAADAFEDGLYAYLLLALFRYQAGQRFDFLSCALPGTITPMMRPVCRSIQAGSGRCELRLENKWLATHSFNHNPTLFNALKKSLIPNEEDSMSKRVLASIDSYQHPARLRLPVVAEQLGMSEANIRKQLKSEGVSFTQLLKRAIHDLAAQHLLAGNKAQSISELLGFSDRRAFDRSFKEFTGISPGQLRQLGNRLRFQRGNQQLTAIVTALPPLPKTVQSILALDDETMRINDVVSLIEQDPIFRAHIMAKASRAVFGRAPSSLNEAVSRNLGLGKIKSLAVLFAAQQQLSEQSVFHGIEQLTDCMLLSECLSLHIANRPEQAIMLFGLLSLLLLFHQDCVYSERVLILWQQSSDFADFRQLIRQDIGICLYGASSLMLLKWGMSGELNRQLWALCDVKQSTLSEKADTAHVCHDIAMTQIMPCRGGEPLAPHQGILSDDQREALVNTLTSWNSLG